MPSHKLRTCTASCLVLLLVRLWHLWRLKFAQVVCKCGNGTFCLWGKWRLSLYPQTFVLPTAHHNESHTKTSLPLPPWQWQLCWDSSPSHVSRPRQEGVVTWWLDWIQASVIETATWAKIACHDITQLFHHPLHFNKLYREGFQSRLHFVVGSKEKQRKAIRCEHLINYACAEQSDWRWTLMNVHSRAGCRDVLAKRNRKIAK